MIDAIGYLATTLTIVAFIPLARLTRSTRRADGVSLGLYVDFTLGVTLRLLIGLVIGAWPIVVARAITLTLAPFILGTKLPYG